MIPLFNVQSFRESSIKTEGRQTQICPELCGVGSRNDILVQGGLIKYHEEAIKGREIELLIYFIFGSSRLGAAPGQLSLGGCSSWENLRIQKDASKVIGKFFPETEGAFQGAAPVSNENKHNFCQ